MPKRPDPKVQYSIRKFFLRASAEFMAIMGFGEVASKFSDAVEGWIHDIATHAFALPLLYVGYLVLHLGYEGVRYAQEVEMAEREQDRKSRRKNLRR